jgi:hypothetical protein
MRNVVTQIHTYIHIHARDGALLAEKGTSEILLGDFIIAHLRV